MDIINNIINYMIELFGMFIILCYLRFFNNGEIKSKKIELVSYFIWLSIGFYMSYIVGIPILSIIFNSVVLFCISFNYSSTIPRKIFASAITMIIILSVETVIIMIVGKSLLETNNDTHINIYIKVTQLCIWILMSKFLDNSIRAKKTYIQWYIPIIFAIFMLFLYMVLQRNIFISTHLLLGITLMVSMIVSLIYIHKLDIEKLQYDNKISQQQVESYQRQYDLLHDSFVQFNQFRHDVKDYFLDVNGHIIDTYGADPRMQELMNGVLMKTLNAEKFFIDTDNLLIDSIINAKIKEATEKGIKVERKILIPEKMEVDQATISMVLDKIFDAVTDETAYTEEKEIDFVMRYESGFVYCYWIHSDHNANHQAQKRYYKRQKHLIQGIRAALEPSRDQVQCVYYAGKVIWDVYMYAGAI